MREYLLKVMWGSKVVAYITKDGHFRCLDRAAMIKTLEYCSDLPKSTVERLTEDKQVDKDKG